MKTNKCPNCGSTQIFKYKSWTNKIFKYSRECAECHWCGSNAITELGATIKWNMQRYNSKH